MTTDEQLTLLAEKYEALRFRMERQEQALQALLAEVASNPHLAVEMANHSLAQHDEAKDKEKQGS